MARYFDFFPRVAYDISGKQYTTLHTTTNIFFRLQIIRSVLSENISSYYEYLIRDGDRPENLAFNVYADAEAHWIILLANNMVDPQYDWPLDTRSFATYIINKYGSIENAKITVHHYEKVTIRQESLTGTITETRQEINEDQVSQNQYDNHETYDNLPKSPSTIVHNMGNGRTVTETYYGRPVYMYDWESDKNDAKRAIKIIKPEYYSQIIEEFNKLTKFASAPYLRRLA